MDRSNSAPTRRSPLRRIAYGVTNLDSLRPDDIDRLNTLLLVEERRSGIVMTQLGRSRIAQLPALRLIATLRRPSTSMSSPSPGSSAGRGCTERLPPRPAAWAIVPP